MGEDLGFMVLYKCGKCGHEETWNGKKVTYRMLEKRVEVHKLMDCPERSEGQA